MHPRSAHPFGRRANLKRRAGGFTLLELCVAVAVLSFLIFLILPVLAKAQSKMRSNRCLSNLQDIGTAVGLYLQDSNDKFPYAALRFNLGKEEHHLAWDDLMGPYLGVDMTEDQRNQDGAVNAGSFKLLSCPQDTVPVRLENGVDKKETRRSYALPEHNLGLNTLAGRKAATADWPPNPVNLTGIGIRLDGRPGHVSPRWNPDDEPGSTKAPRWQSAFNVPMIQAPAATLFMTEHFNGANRVGAWEGSALTSSSEHYSQEAPSQTQINYLMIDGHVESRTPQSVAEKTKSTGPSGFWTIWQDD